MSRLVEKVVLPIFGEMYIANADEVSLEATQALQEIFKKLYDYEEAEEEGLLLRLPCKVGDTIFEINYKSLKKYKVTGFSYGRLMGQDEEGVMSKNEILIHICNQNKDITGYFVASEIGEDIFLTREQAEQKLKEMEAKAK